MMFRGELHQGHAEPGIESLETALLTEQQIPWNELAFPVMRETLKLYYQDKASGHFHVHSGDLVRGDDQQFTVTIHH